MKNLKDSIFIIILFLSITASKKIIKANNKIKNEVANKTLTEEVKAPVTSIAESNFKNDTLQDLNNQPKNLRPDNQSDHEIKQDNSTWMHTLSNYWNNYWHTFTYMNNNNWDAHWNNYWNNYWKNRSMSHKQQNDTTNHTEHHLNAEIKRHHDIKRSSHEPKNLTECRKDYPEDCPPHHSCARLEQVKIKIANNTIENNETSVKFYCSHL